jgi:alginate O-acetyltransferase complex protein AlgI
MTEITDNIDIGRGILFYDAACGVCRGGMERFGERLRRRGFRLMPLQSPQANELTGRPTETLMEEAHLLTPRGHVLRGIDTVLYIAAASPITRPLVWLARLPGVMPLLQWGYRLFARNRYRVSAACGLQDERPSRLLALLPIPLVAAAFAAGQWMPAWAWMWTIAWSIYFACKWATLWPARARVSRASPARSIAYLLANPGMDADAFLHGDAPPRPAIREWLAAMGKTLAGAAFLWIIPRLLIGRSPMLAGWAAMIGIALTLHFGLLHAVVLAWRRAGVAADPLMRRPTRATSLANFWGRRWNMGFRALAHDLVFAPLVAQGWSAAAATAIVFAISGVVHDAVISIPARGGYGLPTLYFLLQLAGLLIERTAPLRRLTRRHRWLGRAYAIIFTLAPAPLLFHGPFVANVILPFLYAIGGRS